MTKDFTHHIWYWQTTTTGFDSLSIHTVMFAKEKKHFNGPRYFEVVIMITVSNSKSLKV